jgi:hypothetical protein
MCAWQIVYTQLSQLLSAERCGEPLALRPLDAAEVMLDAIARHVETLHAKWLEAGLEAAPTRGLRLELSCKRRTVGPLAMETVYRRIANDCIVQAKNMATSNGLTLNALLLGSLASLLHAHSRQICFSIAQTYLGRRHDQLAAVGSFSTQVRRDGRHTQRTLPSTLQTIPAWLSIPRPSPPRPLVPCRPHHPSALALACRPHHPSALALAGSCP